MSPCITVQWDNILKNHRFIRADPSLIIKTTGLVIIRPTLNDKHSLKKFENLHTNVHVLVARHFFGYQNISL